MSQEPLPFGTPDGTGSAAAGVHALVAQGYEALRRADHAAALQCFTQALARNPQRADLLNNCGALHDLMGRPHEALRLFKQAETLDPTSVEVLNNLGRTLGKLDQHEAAVTSLTRALQLRPGYFDALYNLAFSLGRLYRYAEALISLDRALEVHPGDAGILCNRGAMLDSLCRYEEALACYERILAQEPGHLSASLNRATILMRLYRLEESRAIVEAVLASHPDNVEALYTRGSILGMQNRRAEARACFERVLAINPDDSYAMCSLGMIELGEGHLIEGFRLQESRWRNEPLARHMFKSDAPQWRGGESLTGRTILLHREQGLGDTLHFVRYALRVAQLGAKVILCVQAPLRELLADLPGMTVVISDTDPVPPHDFQCPLLSLPVAFATTLTSIPGSVPYVQADPIRVAEWRERLGPATRPRIGIVWAGRQRPPINVPRDMSLQHLLPLLELDAEFISLQKDVPAADAELLETLPNLRRLGESLGSFADTAALIATLDLVITVDTSMVHLAGALGMPVWMMNRLASCWRWFWDGRTDSPWYPTARLFRQPALGDWKSLVKEVRAALESFVQQWRLDPQQWGSTLIPPRDGVDDSARGTPAPDRSNTAALPAPAPIREPAPAITRVDGALAMSPDSLDLLATRAMALARRKHYEPALQTYRQALAIDPGHRGALLGGAAALLALDRCVEALEWADRALEAAAGDTEVLMHRGCVLDRLSRCEEALDCFDGVLAQKPEHFHARLNRAKMLYRLHRPHEALEASQQALGNRPDSVVALNVQGAILTALNRNAESRACIERTLALDPGYASAISNLGFLELAEGNLARGFRLKEIRWQTEELAGHTFKSEAPLWLGEQSLAGKTLLLYAEQGYGDTLQFVRYALLTAQQAATVILLVQPELRELLGRLPGVSTVLGYGDPVPPHHLQCSLMSVPLAFPLTLDSIPRGVPYVQADPQRVQQWRERLGPQTRPRIGIVWAGRQYPPVNIPRDMSLQQLVPLLALDAEFISLQKDVPAADAALLGTLSGLRRLGENLGSFADTAALVATLDLVFTVDTAMVHLAGALGKRVWMMNRFASCWRWLRDGRTDSPWYPTLRLYRQPSFGDWDAVVNELKAALQTFIEGWTPQGTAVSPARALPPPISGDVMQASAVLLQQGVTLGRSGRHAEALACFDKALTFSPDSPELLCHRATALAAMKQHAPALACFQRVLTLDDAHLGALLGGGTVLMTVRRFAEALELLERALQIDPGHPSALSNRAAALASLGRRRDALAGLEQARVREPEPTELMSLRGRLLLEEGRSEEALATFEKLAQRDPANLEARGQQALALLKLDRRQEALARLDRLLELRPDDPGALLLRGLILHGALLHEEALESFDRVLAVQPGNVHACRSRASALLWLHRYEESLEAVRPALAREPDNVEALIIRSGAFWGLKRHREAREGLEHALALQPDNSTAANNMSFIELGEGNLLHGFRRHQARWRTEAFAAYGASFARHSPLWTGEQSITGKTLLLHYEQGYGDTLQFVRFASLAAQRGARVLLRTQPELRDLLASVPGVSAVFGGDDPMPPHDFHCPLLNLPVVFETTLDSIPCEVPYVRANPSRIAAWHERLGPQRRPRIGLVWAGHQHPSPNTPRDMALRQLLPLLTLDADLISLQKDVPRTDAVLLASMARVLRYGETLESFADTAALLTHLDLLIAVDTAAAHLAGAMGRPVWLMNRFASCWRWLRDARTDSPWYPTLRLFRQQALGDWAPVVQEVRGAFDAFLGQWTASGRPQVHDDCH